MRKFKPLASALRAHTSKEYRKFCRDYATAERKWLRAVGLQVNDTVTVVFPHALTERERMALAVCTAEEISQWVGQTGTVRRIDAEYHDQWPWGIIVHIGRNLDEVAIYVPFYCLIKE